MPPSPGPKKLKKTAPISHETPHEEEAEGVAGKTVPEARAERDFRTSVRARLRDMGRGIWRRVTGLPRLVLWLVGLLFALLVALGLFLANPNWNWFKPALTSLLQDRLNRSVQIDGDLRVHLFRWTPDATIYGLKISHPDGLSPDRKTEDRQTARPRLAEVQKVALTAELMPLFIGRTVLTRLEINRPVIDLYQDAEGRANWDFSDGKVKGEPTKLPPIKDLIISDGQIVMTSLSRRLRFSGTINARETQGAGQKALHLTGDGSLNGRIFALEATGGALLKVRHSTPYPFDMRIRAGSTTLTAKGKVLRPFDLGQVEGAVSVEGRNLAGLYYLTGLSLPDTSGFRLAAQVRRNDRVYDISGIDGRVGRSDLQGKLKVELRPDGRPYLTGDLNSRSLDLEDLGSLFGATKANAPVGVSLKADALNARTSRRLLPDASLDVNRVRGMDAKVTYRASSVKARPSLPLREVSLGVNLNKGLLILDPVQFSFPQGRLTGTARIDARHAVQTNEVDFSLRGVRVQDMVPALQGAKPIEGLLHGRLKLAGNGASVHDAAAVSDGEFTVVMPGGRIRQSLAELMGVNATKGLFLYLSKDPKETNVRCAVAHFEVQNGIMRAKTIVLDTGVVRVNGSGTLNLKDERLNLLLKGRPKKFRLVRINVPLVVGGNLSAPSIGVKPGPALLQGGLAAALNSVVPFFGLDTAENASCTGLVSQAKAQGAPVR
ncbi:AsmA family protein [Asticcacaulis sp. DW145]|uniref:AsmA family protein n=1 Tax=Asticcacaulis sp. DW145 TaxID=3095608 RepID=UPI0030921C52|nr:AsmA family protein [Asticcacaulis sp. DW145]